MPTICRATPKNSTSLIDEKLKYVVVKDGIVKILNNKKYSVDSSRDLIFVTGKSNAEGLKAHIKENIEKLNINYPTNFLELLEDKFDIQEQKEFNQVELQDQEKNSQLTPKLDREDENLLEAIPQSPRFTLTSARPKSLNPADDADLLHKKFSSQRLGKSNSQTSFVQQCQVISPKLSSSQNSIISQDSLENAERAQLIDGAQKIRSFFTKKENLSHIENHALNIQNGYFNGEKKSKILLNITQLAAQIRDVSQNIGKESSNERIQSLKQNVSELDKMINNKQNLDTLSRYRGFSPFKCFATLWGGGRVKSIEYVEQLREQVGSLANDLAALRPTM